MQTQGRVAELLQQTDKNQITTSRLSDDAIQKIKNIVQSEQAQCEITSPFHKLETFFINVVQQAQQQGQPTSGALSSTQISDFLATKTSVKSILDKLVETPVSDRQPPQPETGTPYADTEPVQPIQTTKDDELLRNLTQKPAADETEPVSSADLSQNDKLDLPSAGPGTPGRLPEEAQPPETNKDILDELTKRPVDETEQTDKSAEGDEQNA